MESINRLIAPSITVKVAGEGQAIYMALVVTHIAMKKKISDISIFTKSFLNSLDFIGTGSPGHARYCRNHHCRGKP